MSYGKKLVIAIDQLINALFGGWPDETLSSRAWRFEQAGQKAWIRKLIDVLFFFDKNHCEESFKSEREGRQLPPEMRNGTGD